MIPEKNTRDMFLSTFRKMAGISMLLLLSGTVLFYSCRKETPTESSPDIRFVTGDGLLAHDTILAAGQRVRIGISALGRDARITYFSVRLNDGINRILLDSGMNTSTLNYTLEVIKTNAPLERWTFFAMDRNRVADSISIYLTKADTSAWKPIRSLENIILGAQENSTTGSFYSLQTETVMTLEEAYLVQPLTDIIYYYGIYEGTLSSPNEAEAPGFFTGSHGLSAWTVKNESRYDTTLLTTDMFDKSLNDSLILAAYEPTAGKKKGKYLQPGMVFSFRSPAGKLGLISVREVTPAPAGSARINIKIQE